MVDKGQEAGMNIILARVQKQGSACEHHLVAMDWPRETKYWNAKEKEKAMKDVHQLVKKTRGIDIRMYCQTKYFTDVLDMDNTLGKIFEKLEKESIEVIGVSLKFWNERKPRMEFKDQRARLQVLSPQMVDESGEVYAVQWDSFEPNGKMLNWLVKMKGNLKRKEVDRIQTNVDGTDNQLVIWVKNRK